MNLDELKRRPRFKNCATDDDFLREIGLLETEAGKSRPLMPRSPA